MSFSRSHIETGRVKYDAGSSNSNEQFETFQVTFDKVFANIPNVTLTVENSCKKAIAQNVNTSGFQLIISDSGFDTGVSTIYVHYYAILVS